MRRGPAACAATALVLTVTGCGELGADFRGTRPDPPGRLSAAAIAQQPAGSPARALLSWCSALQGRDRAQAERLYVPAARRDRNVLRGEIEKSVFVVTAAGCPTVLESIVNGQNALVLTQLTLRRVAPNGRVDLAVSRLAFNLRRSGGAWAVLPGAFRAASFPKRAIPADQVVQPHLVAGADLRLYPSSSPQRAALGLLQVLQYSDPVAALPYFGREWGLSLGRLATTLRNLGAAARTWQVPRDAGTHVTGDVATVRTVLSKRRASVEFRRRAGRWELVRFRYNGIDLPERRGAAARP